MDYKFGTMYRVELVDGRITDTDLNGILDEHAADVTRFNKIDTYAKGDNYTILAQANKDDGIPDNKIPVPYGRKILTTIFGYLFGKPIQYELKDENIKAALDDRFSAIKNDKKNAQIGNYLLKYGIGVKLFYIQDESGSPQISYSAVDPKTIIPVYDFSIDGELVAVIRYYLKNVGGASVTKVEVYYKDIIQYFTKTGGKFVPELEKPNGLNSVPCVVYMTDDAQGVFEPVTEIIDAIDTMISTNMNEVQRFELAYLILTGQLMDDDDIDKTKKNGVFMLDKESTIAYLTKQINDTFNGNVLAFLIDQVHKQSCVPDFSSKDFAALSGIALQYKLLDLETLASGHESIFKNGEDEAIKIIINFMLRSSGKYTEPITITMNRNLPEDIASKMAVAIQMQQAGASRRTVFEYMPMIKNADDEIKEADKEKKKNIETFMGNQVNQFQQDDQTPKLEEDQE